MFEELVPFISQVGFPIVAAIGLYWMLEKQQKAHENFVEYIKEHMTAELQTMQSMRDTLVTLLERTK